MRARQPDHEGYVDCDGVRIGYEVFGEREPTVLLLPTWTIVHSRFWKGQVPYLARHHRVVTYDGPGNGRSSRSLDKSAYDHTAQVGYALAVLDATGTERSVVVGLSMAANWALELAADHPDRVAGVAFIGPTVSLPADSNPRADHFAPLAPLPDLPPSAVPALGTDPAEHWAKYNLEYWLHHYEDFLWFFFGQAYTESHSTKPIEDAVGWGLETSPEVLATHHHRGAYPDEATVRRWAEELSCPVRVIHGDCDRISPIARGEQLAKLAGGDLVVIEGGGHIPLARDPVRVNELLEEFVASVSPGGVSRRVWTRGARRGRRVLFLSSPIGLGHARRDVAVAAELRALAGAEIEWLAQHPVTRVLDAAGERVHPASGWLASESAHVEAESGEHDLHAFEAIRQMDEILVANFMVFQDVVAAEPYDLVVADEGWELDYFLHENPDLKRFAYAWMTDFVGWLPMPDGGKREARVAADYNAEMIGQIARYPRIRDRAVFVGEADDVVPERFGPGLPAIREWTEQHYDFAGYVTGFDPAEYADRDALRAALGYRPGEPVCLVTVGGSGVGTHLLRRVIAAYPIAARQVPGLRMVVVAGPRINPATLPAPPGVQVHGYLPGLYRHLAAADLAIVQGGLTTCMELTALGRPFVYLPLRHHFEQHYHVAHRLDRYHAGVRLDYEHATPDHLADLIATHLGQPTHYHPVTTTGAARAAALLADLL